MLVFFDDILIYTRTGKEHLEHLETILIFLQRDSLYAKESKCDLKITELLYLGHIISAEWVHMDPKKIHTILDWPPPENLT